MHKNAYFKICNLVTLLFVVLHCHIAEAKPTFSTEEQLWIAQNRTLKVGTLTYDYPPYILVSGQNEVKGIYPDFLAQTARKAGFNIEHIFFSSIAELETALASSEIDIVTGLNTTLSRQRIALFTEPFLEVPRSVLTLGKSSNKPSSIKAFQGLVFAAEDGFASKLEIEQLINPPFFNVDNTQEAITAVKYKLAEAYYGDKITASFFLQQYPDSGLYLNELSDVPVDQSRFAIARQKKELVPIINKAVASISDATRSFILQRWNAANLKLVNGKVPIELNDSEKEWLAKNPTLYYGALHTWHPILFEGEAGEQQGLSIDVLKLVAGKLGLSLEYVKTKSWTESLAQLEQGKIHLIPAVVRNPFKEKLMDFSTSYHTSPWVVVAKRNSGFLLEELNQAGVKIANPKGGYAKHMLSQHFPKAQIIETVDLAQSFELIEDGKADVVFSILSTVAPWLQGEFTGQYQILNDLTQERYIAVHMGLSKSQPILKGLIDKAIKDISNEKLDSLNRSWLKVNIKQGVEYSQIILYGSYITAAIVLSILVFLAWSRELKKEIKQRSLAEKRARDAELELSSMTDMIPGAVVQFTIDVHKHLKFNYVSQGIKDITPLSAEALLSDARQLFNVIPEDEKPKLLKARESYFANSVDCKDNINLEFKVQYACGAVNWLNLVAYESQGKAGKIWNGVILKINERKEQALAMSRAKQAAEEAAEAKSRFLAMMSHEIRTPVSGIIGMLALFEESKLSKEQRFDLKTIGDSANNLLHILNDVLDHSKMEQGQFSVDLVQCNLLTLCENSIRTHCNNAHQKGLGVHFNFADNINESVITDPVRLQQVLSNLISNAVKFTEFGSIYFNVAVLSSDAYSQTVQFKIRDTGIGIAKKNQSKLFSPFVQAESSTSRKFGGTGLGLSISKMLIERLGGEISLDSEENQGTEFTILLKIKTGENLVESKIQDHMPVIIIDDGSSEVSSVKAILSAKDYSFNSLFISHNIADIEALLPAGPCVFICREGCVITQKILVKHEQSKWITLSSKGFSPEPEQLLLSTNPLLPSNVTRVINRAMQGEQQTTSVDTSLTVQERESRRATAIEQGRLVLVAEDHPTNQLVIQRQLDRLGFAADIVNDGEEAIKALQAHSYGLLLTDCHMPNIDGYQLTRILREQGSDMPIIALTANALTGEFEHCIEVGMNDYLTKPVSAEVLKDKIEQWLESGTSQTEAHQEVVPETDSEFRSKLFNFKFLQETFGDKTLVIELLHEFVKSTLLDLHEIDESMRQKDLRSVALLAHRLKGAASMIESQLIVNAAVELEEFAHQGAIPQAQQVIETLKGYLEELSKETGAQALEQLTV